MVLLILCVCVYEKRPCSASQLSSQPASISCSDASVNCVRSFAQTGGAASALPEAGLRSPNQAHSRGSVVECKSLCFNHIRLSSHLAHLLVLCFQDFSACAKLLHPRGSDRADRSRGSPLLFREIFLFYFIFRINLIPHGLM